ncbi:hypothetical protein C8Q80DRAFT_446996 [Daedaleopsis nitida]|nr:hypothetical protein C8Q80DRAFT_446996 [Daedaleopsis nitida]
MSNSPDLWAGLLSMGLHIAGCVFDEFTAGKSASEACHTCDIPLSKCPPGLPSSPIGGEPSSPIFDPFPWMPHPPPKLTSSLQPPRTSSSQQPPSPPSSGGNSQGPGPSYTNPPTGSSHGYSPSITSSSAYSYPGDYMRSSNALSGSETAQVTTASTPESTDDATASSAPGGSGTQTGTTRPPSSTSASTATPAPASSASSSGLSAGAIAGIVIAIAAVLVLLGAGALWCRRRRRRVSWAMIADPYTDKHSVTTDTHYSFLSAWTVRSGGATSRSATPTSTASVTSLLAPTPPPRP